jgi:hypothetical protein
MKRGEDLPVFELDFLVRIFASGLFGQPVHHLRIPRTRNVSAAALHEIAEAAVDDSQQPVAKCARSSVVSETVQRREDGSHDLLSYIGSVGGLQPFALLVVWLKLEPGGRPILSLDVGIGRWLRVLFSMIFSVLSVPLW